MKTWTTSKGKTMTLQEMNDYHLLNTARFLIRKLANAHNGQLPKNWDELNEWVLGTDNDILYDMMDELETRGLYSEEVDGFLSLINANTFPQCSVCAERKLDCYTRNTDEYNAAVYCNKCFAETIRHQMTEDVVALALAAHVSGLDDMIFSESSGICL